MADMIVSELQRVQIEEAAELGGHLADNAVMLKIKIGERL